MCNEEAVGRQHGPPEPDEANAPGILMSEALQELVERSGQRCANDIVERIMPLVSQMGQLGTRCEDIAKAVRTIGQQVNTLTAANPLIEHVARTNELLGHQYYAEHVVQPLIRLVIPVFDLITDARTHWETGSKAVDPEVVEIVDSAWNQLEQFLAVYDIHLVRHDFRDPFDPRLMQPAKWVHTGDREADGKVFASIRPGFRSGEGRMLRFEKVSLLKYEPVRLETTTQNERKNDYDPRN